MEYAITLTPNKSKIMCSLDVFTTVGVSVDCCEETDKFCLSVCLSETSNEGFNVGRLTGIG